MRRELRAALVAFVRERSVPTASRAARRRDYVEAAARDVRPRRPDDRLRAPRRDLQAAPPAHATTRSGPSGSSPTDRRPIQLVIAGKAHPQDEEAKQALVRRSSRCAERRRTSRARVVFLEDYDLRDAPRTRARACDVWLNLPRPPLEASGTSGMKAALNGGLNLSVLDGWWAEGVRRRARLGRSAAPGGRPGGAGRRATPRGALRPARERGDPALLRARRRAASARLARARARPRCARLVPRFSAERMLREYVARAYRRG